MTGPNELHVPVMTTEVLQALQVKRDGVYADLTYGCGGHSRAIHAISKTTLWASDRDADAVARAGIDPCVRIEHARFSQLDSVLPVAYFDGILADLGLSSAQIDSDRGFSFTHDDPLDMRMGLSEMSVADLIRTTTLDSLTAIIKEYGEEPRARAIARAIIDNRSQIHTTSDLARIVCAKTYHRHRHPATRTFQALRIAVNDELQEIHALMNNIKKWLKPTGRAVIITFHSLEDRIVKHSFKTWSQYGRIFPSDYEISLNARARSAKLRWGVQ